jgi:hypothetical protein
MSEHKPRPDPQPPEEERASGTIQSPIPPGEPQAGDTNELASTLGGPVDVFPGRQRKPPQQSE